MKKDASEKILVLSKSISGYMGKNKISPPNRYSLQPFLEQIKGLNKAESREFMVISFEKKENSYSVPLMTCLPEIWKDLEFKDLTTIHFSKSAVDCGAQSTCQLP